jgi:hypothetical protein
MAGEKEKGPGLKAGITLGNSGFRAGTSGSTGGWAVPHVPDITLASMPPIDRPKQLLQYRQLLRRPGGDLFCLTRDGPVPSVAFGRAPGGIGIPPTDSASWYQSASPLGLLAGEARASNGASIKKKKGCSYDTL